jgi:hypothetical protein
MTLPDAPAAIRELCRRRVPDALAAMFRIVVDPGAARTTRLAALRQLAGLVARQVISIDECAAARAAADVSRDDWVAPSGNSETAAAWFTDEGGRAVRRAGVARCDRRALTPLAAAAPRPQPTRWRWPT